MRINKYVAAGTSLSRRAADTAVTNGRVTINGHTAETGSQVKPTDTVCFDGVKLAIREAPTTIILNKPVGYVCSRNGQGSQTIFELLPPEYRHLQPVGRLDKDSSGLLLLTDDGDLANELTHPRYAKTKIYEVTLDKPLAPLHQQMITDIGITLQDGKSQFLITKIDSQAQSTGGERIKTGVGQGRHGQSRASREKGNAPPRSIEQSVPIYQITMTEGRNRQIRRTLSALGYNVTTLHRTKFGSYSLHSLGAGQHSVVSAYEA
ncbi:rRNA pseudouridine synthase [Candidatus Saccharibacteria bacterium]|nr:MAG: rRNA pseudouridine synthase [Candidatus Saccharibacteria bacterium]